ncbi:MAG: M48 family metalloprotease [Candidatus Eiseniibacteriota bacterium]
MAPARAWPPIASLVIATLLAALLAGCATNPVTGRREFSLVSAGQEAQMGREGFPAVVAEYGIHEDSTTQRYVEGIGRRLAKVSHLPDLEWHFTVIDDPSVNAFAMPGGYIYVTRGILAHFNSEAQLAGVLGHEIAHVTHRHSAAQISRQQLAGIGLGVASILSSTAARYGQVAQQALGLMFLKYSRAHENEADQSGVDYAARAGYEPNEIPPTYAMLKRVGERAGQRLPAFLSTHPDPGDREVRTTELARVAREGKSGLLVRRDEYMRRLDGMVFGHDPRGGYFEGDDFYHPEMAFVMTFPAGWKRENTRAAVTASPGEHAAMQLTLADAADLSPSDYVAKLEGSGRIAGSRGAAERVGGLPAWIGRIAVAGEGGTERVLAAAFIRRGPSRMIQILGGSAVPGDAEFNKVLASARSFRPLTDPARLAPTPARVWVTRVQKAGTFAALVEALGPQGLDLDGTAILNHREPGEVVAAGEYLKTVSPAKLR